jgi:hypothetical protein
MVHQPFGTIGDDGLCLCKHGCAAEHEVHFVILQQLAHEGPVLARLTVVVVPVLCVGQQHDVVCLKV